MSEFWESYKDPRWQRKRLEIMQRDKWKCKCCESDDDTLNVHHSYYDRDAKPWEYPSEALVTLCKHCHDKKHALKKKLLVILAYLGEKSAAELVGYGCAVAACESNFKFTLSPPGAEVGVINFMAATEEPYRLHHYGKLVGKVVNYDILNEAESDAGYDMDGVDAWREKHDYEQLSYAAFAFNG